MEWPMLLKRATSSWTCVRRFAQAFQHAALQFSSCFLFGLADSQIFKSRFLLLIVAVPISVSRGALQQVFALHDREQLQRLRKSWVGGLFKRQPIGSWMYIQGVPSARAPGLVEFDLDVPPSCQLPSQLSQIPISPSRIQVQVNPMHEHPDARADGTPCRLID